MKKITKMYEKLMKMYKKKETKLKFRVGSPGQQTRNLHFNTFLNISIIHTLLYEWT